MRGAMIWFVLLANAVVGAVGGLINALLDGDLKTPMRDEENGVWRPGWIGNVLVGLTAAVVFWALYGGIGEAVLIGASSAEIPPVWTVAELGGSLLAGIGGSKVLASALKIHTLNSEKEDLNRTREDLTDLVQILRQKGDALEL